MNHKTEIQKWPLNGKSKWRTGSTSNPRYTNYFLLHTPIFQASKGDRNCIKLELPRPAGLNLNLKIYNIYVISQIISYLKGFLTGFQDEIISLLRVPPLIHKTPHNPLSSTNRCAFREIFHFKRHTLVVFPRLCWYFFSPVKLKNGESKL